MKEIDFYNWLIQQGFKETTARNRKSNCLNVCKIESIKDFETINRKGFIELSGLV